MVNETHPPFIAVSYNFRGDRSFVSTLCDELKGRGLLAWFLDQMSEPEGYTVEDILGGKRDWRIVSGNWQAVFIEHLLSAHGVIVVLSPGALASHSGIGRGMWRERPAIDFIRRDNPLRVLDIDRTDIPDGEPIPTELLEDVVAWGERVLALPGVQRSAMSSAEATDFNVPTGQTGPVQLEERKPHADAWYELVRVDLYDVQWHCRSCGLSSLGYVMAHYDPPDGCPRCGFARQE